MTRTTGATRIDGSLPPCEAGCDKGWIACPHTDLEYCAEDGMWWCRDCDTPEDEPNPTKSCPACE